MGQRKIKDMAKLFIAGIMIVWIFIKSPLNPLYQDYSYGEMFSVYYYFIFWVLAFAFIGWLAFFTEKSVYKKKSTIIFIAAVFLWYMFYVPFGFEVTDTGHHLSKQWRMFNGMWLAGFDATAGTNLIGGAWLKILGMPSVLWSRIGFVIVQILIFLFIYKIVTLYNKNTKVLFIALSIIFSTSTIQNYRTINYDNLPFLFALAATYFLIKGMEIKNRSGVFLVIGGIMTSFAVFSKITYLIFIPVIIIIFLLFGKNSGPKGLRRDIFLYLSGLVFSISGLILFMVITGSYGHYIQNFSNIFVELLHTKTAVDSSMHDHSFSTLYNIYRSHNLMILNEALLAVLVIIFAGVGLNKFKNLKTVRSFFYVFLIWYVFHHLFNSSRDTYTLIMGMVSMSFAFSVVWVIYYADERESKKEMAVLIVSVLLYLVSFAGSDLGITPVGRSSSLVLLSFVTIMLFDDKKKRGIKFSFLIPVALTVLWLVRFADGTPEHFPYRDTDMKMIKFSFESKPLLGIRSNYERVRVTDSLYSYLSENEDLDKKKIFFTHNNSMGYYIFDKNHFFDKPWDTLVDLDEIKRNFKKEPPRIIVTSEFTHRYRFWPYSEKLDKWLSDAKYEKKSQRYWDFYKKFIAENGYKKVYNNSFYNVYELKKMGEK